MDILKSITIFAEVVKQGSFVKTAEKLNLVPSAVSRQINELEQKLECKLINRTTRSMSVTDEGRYYLARFEQILENVESLEEEITTRKKVVRGKLTLTTPKFIGRRYLQPIIRDFLETYPEVTISWLIFDRYANLVEEGIDLALRVGHLADSNLIARTIDHMRLKTVASPEYLGKNPEIEVPKDLQQHKCIIDTVTRAPKRWRFRENDSEFHVTVGGTIEVNLGEMVAEFSAQGMGVAWLPDFIVDDYIEQGQLVHILSKYEVTPPPISIVYPERHLMSPVLKNFVEHVMSAYPKHD